MKIIDNRSFLFISLLLLIASTSDLQSQTKYWICFRDKEPVCDTQVSDITLLNRHMMGIPIMQQSDLPVTENYVTMLADQYHIRAENRSRWLNAVSAFLTQEQVNELRSLSFVEMVRPIRSNAMIPSALPSSWDDVSFAKGLASVHGESFMEAGLTGKGVSIGILDIGFIKADIDPSLKTVFDNRRVLGIRNYITPKDNNIFQNVESTDDKHGTLVWRMIAGNNSDTNKQEGLAVDAQFYLARTDNGRYEFRGEEDNWVKAIEWMDSVGVRLVHSSLGYSLDFNDPKENYTPSQMDGKSTVVSKIARMAVEEKGMIVVTSAGNDGHKPSWKVVSAPADVEGVIAVGAVDEYQQKQAYSGEGPPLLSYTKPDVMCYSNNGTSLAAPVITGMIACMLQRKPYITSKEVQSMLHNSSHLNALPNNFLGAGVPDGNVLLKMLSGEQVTRSRVEEIRPTGSNVRIPSSKGEQAVVFHKKTPQVVLEQKLITADESGWIVNRPKSVVRSTIVIGQRLIEVYWK